MALSDFINKIFSKDDKTAKSVAKDRLRVVLMHDRAAIPAPVMEELRRELMAVLARYVDIDETASVTLEDYEDAVALVANVPIRRNRLSSTKN